MRLVDEERDAKGIQRIYLGSAAQPSVNLSRFDWGGPRVISKNELGHWRVTTEEGTYRVSFDFPALETGGVAHLKYHNVHIQAPLEKGQTKVVFEGVSLPEGEGNFHAYLKTERLAQGPSFVDVVRME